MEPGDLPGKNGQGCGGVPEMGAEKAAATALARPDSSTYILGKNGRKTPGNSENVAKQSRNVLWNQEAGDDCCKQA